MAVGPSITTSTLVYIAGIELTSIIMFGVAEILGLVVDKKLDLDPPRRHCPVPEAVDIMELPKPYNFIKKLMLPVFIIIQVSLFGLLVVQHYFHIHEEP